MAFCGDREDIVSAFMTATASLLEKYNIDPTQVGRLECGTETLIDKSKSVKSHLMSLFEASGSHDLEGVDNINACYGGTAALLNTLAWMQSPGWDGRYGIVVCGDIAVYEPGPARPTGGMGVTAMLIGPDAPIAIDAYRGSHFENVYDFYKPNLESEYPAVDGHLSISCYYRSLDGSYERYKQKFKAANRREFSLHSGDASFALFHSPFTKLVRKSFARLHQNDWLLEDKMAVAANVKEEWKQLSLGDTYTHSDIQKEFIRASDKAYTERVVPSLLLSKQLGNSYTGSLYASLASLVCTRSDDDLIGKKALLFSYGSGSAATMFSATLRGPFGAMREALDLQNRLDNRRHVDATEYLDTMKLREETHSLADYTPIGSVDDLATGTYYLSKVDALKRRTYERK